MNITPRTTAVFRAAIACAAGLAGVSAHAVDWTGYLRGGPAATNVSGESRQCYGLNSPGLKYRLGNECDFYGEFQLAQAMKADGVDFNAVLMTNYYSPQTESNNNFGVEQAYVEMKGVDIAPQALFWMGKRRDRDDVHIVDTFFTNMSGVGAGVENIDAGFGKFGFSGYKTDSTPVRNDDGSLATTATPSNGIARLHAQLYDIGVNPDGKLRLVATYSKADSQGGRKGQDGFGFTVEHVQDKFFGGGNHIWAQYSQGSTNINQGFGNALADSGTKTYRIVESPSWQIGSFGGQAIALYQHDKTDTTSWNSYSIGGRGSFAMSKNLKFLTEVGYSNRKESGGPSENLTKVTIGPALSTGPDFWKRPELRLYATFASFNRAAAEDPQNGLPTNKTSAVSYGAQVEIWF
ncbi:MAG: maltoporin [Vitreoscilla sp.]